MAPLPFVKTRPLSQGTQASRDKAKSMVLPSSIRPKTCTALARRLVSGALGVRAVFTQAERDAEKAMLKEARGKFISLQSSNTLIFVTLFYTVYVFIFNPEQKRLAAKQREAAWEGKF